MFCQSFTDYTVPTHPEVSKQLSTCTIATKESSSSSCTDQSIDISEFNEFFVTGRYSDIFKDYNIFPQVIGAGSYGSVRECMHIITGERFAVKTIDKSKINRLDHLQREVELLQLMNHRSIMRLVDIYEDEQYVHMVSDKYTGGELFDKIVNNSSSSGCLQEYEAARIIKQILEAILYLHANGVVHRDIKPENIIFESRQEGSPVRLIDFGLAQTHFPGEEPMKDAVGTAFYMSPDQIVGCYDKSCDMWSIGVVTYILLTGYPPFNGSTDTEIYTSIRRGNLVFESQVWDGLSYGNRDFIRRLLCKDSSLRSTAGEALQHPWIMCHCY